MTDEEFQALRTSADEQEQEKRKLAQAVSDAQLAGVRQYYAEKEQRRQELSKKVSVRLVNPEPKPIERLNVRVVLRKPDAENERLSMPEIPLRDKPARRRRSE